MIFKDYYKILGFDDNKVTFIEIKNAYREKAKVYHPDIQAKNDNPSKSDEIFKDINEAYRILSNEKSRKKYDFSWNRYIGRNNVKEKKEISRNVSEELFSILFGKNIKLKKDTNDKPYYGNDIYTSIEITIEEAFYGVTKQIKLKEKNNQKYDLEIKAGIKNQSKLKVKGAGKPGKNGGKDGDLIVTIMIKDSQDLSLYNTNDLIYKLKISPWEAALGNEKEIELLRNNVKIVIPPNTSSDDRIVIENMGYNANLKRGDLIVEFKIVIPKTLSNDQVTLYKKLKEL